MPESKGPTGDDAHYQPWLRNQSAGKPMARPEPLPTRGLPDPSPARPVRVASGLSADELLARPIPKPEMTIGHEATTAARLRAGAGQWAGRATQLVERAGIAGRVEKLELGRRAHAAAVTAMRLVAHGAAATANASRVAARTSMDAAKQAIGAASPRIRDASEQVRHAVSGNSAKAVSAIAAGTRSAGARARKLAESSPAAALIPVKPAMPASQLDALMETEGQQAPHSGSGLPLFASAQPQTNVETPPVNIAPPIVAASSSLSHAGRSGGGGEGSGHSASDPWHRHPASWIVGGIALALGGFIGGMVWSGGISQRAVTERIVHDYVLNHPEIIPQAMERLQATRVAETIGRQRAAIERPFSGAWAGTADGDVTLVVFTDYACTFCRASEADIERLLREDRRLKIVFRELPILSQESEAAARLALTAARSGRYMDVHRALFASGNPDAAARSAVANRFVVAADAASLANPAITSELRANVALARELGFDGTPSWVVGDKVLTGAVGYDALKAAVAEARG